MAKIKHIAIATQDPDETARFYKEVFDLKEVGRVAGENAEGHYLSDGNVNLAILRFKNPVVAGKLGSDYSGIHHIGFQVDDAEATDVRLRASGSLPMNEINDALRPPMDAAPHGPNVESKYDGPDGVMVDISQHGWVGTGGDEPTDS